MKKLWLTLFVIGCLGIGPFPLVIAFSSVTQDDPGVNADLFLGVLFASALSLAIVGVTSAVLVNKSPFWAKFGLCSIGAGWSLASAVLFSLL